MSIRRVFSLVGMLAPGLAFAQPAGDSTGTSSDTQLALAGYIETYYQLNLRTPSNHITNLRGFDDRDRTFTLSNLALDARAEHGPVTTRLILQVGSTPATYYASAADGEIWRYVQQATFAYAADRLVVDAGLFPSPIGPEVIAVKDNWNWSRSNLFFGLPFFHTGARVAYPLGGAWTGMVHVYNGWNSVVDNNAYPSVAVSAGYASKRINGQLAYFGGIERATGAPEGKPWRNLFDAYATIAATQDLSLLVHADAGFEPNDIGTSSWVSGAVYTKLQLTTMIYAAARGDYFREHAAVAPGARAAPIFWPTTWVASGTVTLAFQPADVLSVRLEMRHDHAKDNAFFGGDVVGDGATMPYVPNRRAQDTLTVGAVAWF